MISTPPLRPDRACHRSLLKVACLFFGLVVSGFAEQSVDDGGTKAENTGPSFYWHNHNTGEVSWQHPGHGMKDGNGRSYFVNPLTGKTQYEYPDEYAWKVVHSEEHDRDYYHNYHTEETTWEKPDVLAWVKVPVPEGYVYPTSTSSRLDAASGPQESADNEESEAPSIQPSREEL